MTGEHLSKEKLQRHYDGDLSGAEAADAQQHLLTCAQCEAELASFERLGDMLRWTTDDATSAADVDFNQMFAQIERNLGTAAHGSNVIPLGAREKRPLLQRAAPVLGAVALAAAALLMLSRTETLPKDASPLAMLDTSNHSEVTSVKFGTNAGQVFRVQVADNESVPVVWIDDNDDDQDQEQAEDHADQDDSQGESEE